MEASNVRRPWSVIKYQNTPLQERAIRQPERQAYGTRNLKTDLQEELQESSAFARALAKEDQQTQALFRASWQKELKAIAGP
jgi:hypothetical protein